MKLSFFPRINPSLFRILILISLVFLHCKEDPTMYSQEFHEKLYQRMKEEGFQGGYTIIKQGKVVLEEKRFFKKKIKLGNIRHFLFSLVVLKLAEEGKLDISDTVAKHLPDFSPESLTIKSLMNHTSGLGSNLEPGGYWIWSKENIGLLARLIQSKTDLPLPDYFEKEIFPGFGMNKSYLTTEYEIISTFQDLIRLEAILQTKSPITGSQYSDLVSPTELKDDYALNRFNYGFGVFTDGDNHWQNSNQMDYSTLYFRVRSENMAILIISPGSQKKGKMISYKSLITESIYNAKRITFMKKFNPKKYLDIQTALEEKSVPGVGIALVRDFKIVWSGNFGITNMETKRPIEPNTRFRAGSLSKPITALAYLMTCETDPNCLDKNLNKFATDEGVDLSRWQNKEKLTPHSLLSHSSGITERENWSLPGNANVERLRDLNRKKGPGLYAYYSPGKKSRYSGGGYAILQEYLEAKESRRFDKIVQEKIFRPLEMNSSSWNQTEASPTESRVSGHSKSNEVLPVQIYSPVEWGAGGLWTTPKDLAHFFIAILKSHNNKPDAKIPRSITDKMLEPIVPAANLSVQSWIGRGIFLNSSGTGPYIYHGGHSLGHKSIALFHLRKGYGVVIMTNSENGSALIWALIRSFSLSQRWDKFIN
jgi:CubicO group peptidase (beta-lactamase class C family)